MSLLYILYIKLFNWFTVFNRVRSWFWELIPANFLFKWARYLLVLYCLSKRWAFDITVNYIDTVFTKLPSALSDIWSDWHETSVRPAELLSDRTFFLAFLNIFYIANCNSLLASIITCNTVHTSQLHCTKTTTTKT